MNAVAVSLLLLIMLIMLNLAYFSHALFPARKGSASSMPCIRARLFSGDPALLVTCAQQGPYKVALEAGKDYYWCSCGRSKSQPFCDSSHKGTAFKPEKYTAAETKTVNFCGCKQSRGRAICDGSHIKLPEDSQGKNFPIGYIN